MDGRGLAVEGTLGVADIVNAKSLLKTSLVEAYSKKKKTKFPEHAEGGEPENHEAPAKGIAASSGRLCPLWVGGGGHALRRHGEESESKACSPGCDSRVTMRTR